MSARRERKSEEQECVKRDKQTKRARATKDRLSR